MTFLTSTQYRSLINTQPQMPKITVSETVFKLILRSSRQNILTNFTAPLGNLWETTAICIDTRLIIIVIDSTQYRLLGWGKGGMLSVNVRSHVLRHLTQRIVKLWKGAQSIELCWSSSTSEVTWGYMLKDKWEERKRGAGWMIDNSLNQT